MPLTARRDLGASGLRVAPLCLGGNVFGWSADEDASMAVLDAYVAAGGNVIDTANIYSAWVPGNEGGESERIIGRWLAGRTDRNDLVIATKVGMQGGVFPKGLTRDLIHRGAEGSLQRLGVDRIDLFYAHEDDAGTPVGETMRAFGELVDQGLVRAVGASNYSVARLTEALAASDAAGTVRFSVLQPHFNLLDRAPHPPAMEELCLREGLGVAPYYALARGFLAGKYRRGEPMPATPRAPGVQRDYLNDRGWAMLDAVTAIAAGHGATPAQVSIAWLMRRPGITSPIASATTVAQVADLAGAASVALSDEEYARLDALGG